MFSVLVLDTNVVLNQVIAIKCLMLKLCEVFVCLCGLIMLVFEFD